jgi:hypothetical protein
MMFPIRINVLSASKKTHLRRLALFTYIKSACAIIFSLLGILAAILIITQKFFIEYRNAFSYNTFAVHPSYHDDTKKVEESHQALRKIDAVQKGFVLWSDRIDEILRVIPHGITVQSVSFDQEHAHFSLAGIADTKEALEAVEQALTALHLLEAVNIPLGELTQRENIPFTVEATLH